MHLILKIIKLAIAALAICVLIAWLTGQILSDRYEFSQWLLWIPTPLAIGFAIAGSACAIPKRPIKLLGKVRLICIAGIIFSISIYFAFIEHRFLRSSPVGNANFKVIHFNANTATDEELENFSSDMLAQNADLIVLTNSGHHRRYKQLIESFNADGSAFVIGPFRVFTRLDILERRRIVSNQGTNVVLLRIDTTSKLGHAVSIYAVDLPSDPKISRMQIAQKLRSMLNDADAPLPDIVLGDFNMTRRGAALSSIFPDLEHAYDQAGHGYGATYPRNFPLLHIDHILLNDDLLARSYNLIDPHAGRHRMQIAEIGTKPQ